ncbi:glutamine-hydrolyzing carbamoyl-phosphate synthase small subunit [Olsenella sp. YH-ols2217]|uniref:Carbamoyl phosphate synthase small chain n=1 Tax=Kribbibacterium absianum TaxID=3044210 RepID=A0ABT6ZJB6_9ACTN|nr:MULTISPECIES: glutamine-hydrolyzing carbamoyl-phosphate synthase small subunit [unclassified Olsenella]MDJ1122701.1 glutamine-hydrolyzing carbamoyl-phosphate synthase small subunit [Olsenella sp. YH-ols2216]MDJ1129139.1 glutamine-hydrolyzing carbamoyl-phosphate synthase small subunit [Olsenella sp. YH-ols2217]
MNPLAAPAGNQPAPALLALENGRCFFGRSCGALGEAFGEAVFNTSMIGYQEVVTDPSYAGQVVALTYPQVGNYGMNARDGQAPHPALEALVVGDLCRTPSHWQSDEALGDYLAREGVVAIEGVDTRALTLCLREEGAMRAAVSTEDLDPESLVERVRASRPIGERDLVAQVSRGQPRTIPARGAARRRVVAVDCGEKAGIMECLAAAGVECELVPWDTPATSILARDPDGVFFSNGPGDPAAIPQVTACARELLGQVPLFGICLGNQVLATAAGASIEKLAFGHHGGNEPVMNLLTGRTEVTAQNHNYGPVFSSLGPLVPELSGGVAEHPGDLRVWSERRIAPVVMNPQVGRVRLTHVNLNDGTPEGLQFLDARAFSLQYHPEARPGPTDARYAFDAFVRLMDGDPEYLEQGRA